jgi:hypothetical protein
MKKIVHTIRARRIHFLWIFMATYMLLHAPWVIYLLCNFDEWVRATESEPWLVVLIMIVLPVVVAILLGVFAYIVYEKGATRKMVYICPLVFFVVLLTLTYLRLAFTDLGALIFCSVPACLYALEIFVATSLAAPPEKELHHDDISQL